MRAAERRLLVWNGRVGRVVEARTGARAAGSRQHTEAVKVDVLPEDERRPRGSHHVRERRLLG